MTYSEFKTCEEKRFAVVMYGGVSLAIYINGVAQELFRLVKSTAPGTDPGTLTGSTRIYRELAEKLGARYVVDILSGASAGGINAVFLAKALANDQRFDALADLWVQEGDISLLINDRTSRDGAKGRRARESAQRPRSLLNGARLYEKLLLALEGMKNGNGGAGRALVEDLDLFVTATDLQGLPVPIRLADDVVYERRHRHVFRFRRREGRSGSAPRNDFADENNEMLAFAARCTSSFPFAFEPVLLRDCSREPAKWKAFFKRYLLNQEQDARPYAGRAFADGGYLDNKPFTYAVNTITERRSDVPADRKLLYIEPSPEEIGSAEEIHEPPDAVMNTLMALSLARYETVSQDLELIRKRNTLIERAERILRGTDDDINKLPEEAQPIMVQDWFNCDLHEMIKRQGIAYAGYLRLRVACLTDDLSEIITAQAGFALDSDEFLAIRYMVRVWRDQRYSYYGWERRENEGKQYFTGFILDFDLGFHIRRLSFSIRKIDNLLVMNEDGKQVLSARRIDPCMNKNSEFREELLRLREALSKAGENIRNLAAGRRSETAGGLSKAVREVGLDRKTLISILSPAREEDRLEAARAFIEAKEEALRAVWEALHAPVKDALDRMAEVKREAGLGKGRPLRKREEADTSPSELARWLVAFSIRMFPYYDLVAYPMLRTAGLGEEMDPAEVFRISPRDPRRLAGMRLGRFGGFFDRTWRKNDILRGRLDGAAKIVAAILQGTAYQNLAEEYAKRAQEAIMEEIRKNPQRYLDLLGMLMMGASPEDRTAFGRNLSKNIQPERALVGTILGRMTAPDLRERFETFEVDKHVQPAFLMKSISRIISVAGKMLKTIGDESGSEQGRKIGLWISSIGAVATGLLDVLLPGSWLHLLGRRWLSLLMLFGIMLVALNAVFHMDGVGLLGGAMAGVSAFLSVLSWFLGRAVRTRKYGPLFAIPVAVLLVLLAVGIVYTPDAINAALAWIIH